MKTYLLSFFLFIVYNVVAQDGSLDTTFKVELPQYARTIQKLSNGKILVFSVSNASINGKYNFYNADGSESNIVIENPPSQSGQNNNWVTDIAEQPDGKIIIVGGTGSPKIYRYQYNATKDTFKIDTAFMSQVGSGADLNIYGVLVQPNNKILIWGVFTKINGVDKGGICRLNANGSIDESFVASGTSNASGISQVIRLADNKYVLTGKHGNFNGQSKFKATMRIHETGQIDTLFSENQNTFARIAIQSSGKIIGWDGKFIERINSDGTPDNTFTPFATNKAGNSSADPVSLHIQKDNKIIVIGEFFKSGSLTLNRMVRLHEDGELDTTFDIGTGPSHTITCSQLTNDGMLYIGGVLYMYNDIGGFEYLARIQNSKGALLPEHREPPIVPTSVKPDNDGTFKFVSVYPNPSKDCIHVVPVSQSNEVYTIQLMELNGRLIKSVSGNYNQPVRIETDTVPSGIYTLMLKSEFGIQYEKISIIK